MPSAEIWMAPEMILLSEVNQRRINICDITYMWNLKKKLYE